MMEETKTARRSKIAGEFIKNSLMAIVRGEFLLRLNVSRYFIHIIYSFILFGVTIWISLMIDTTLAKVEKNKEDIREMEIQYLEKSFDVASFARRGTVAGMLKQLGSDVQEPQKPAMTIKK